MQLAKHTHTAYIEFDGGGQAGQEGGRERARKDGGLDGGSKGRVGEGARGGSEESIM